MSDERFEWNRREKREPFWDDEVNLPTSTTSSLKYRLENPLENPLSRNPKDLMLDIARGLAMIMDQIEEFKRDQE